jgi:anti-sigma factor RsiW
MTCREIQTALSAYIDGELPEEAAAGMFAHLSTCTACREFLTDVLRVRAALHLPSVLTPNLPVDRGHVPRGPLRRLVAQRLEIPFAAAAGIALVLLSISLLSLSLWLHAPPERPPQREVVYMLSLPPVEVHAVKPAEHKPVE